MSNLTVRKSSEQPVASEARQDWEPLRRMRDILRWDPFAELRAFPPLATVEYFPAFEVRETKDAYIFKADVPGVKEQDLDIQATGDRLTVSGKREAEQEEKTDTCYCYERSYGAFTRSFTLPSGVDTGNAQADLKDGVLTLVVQKKPEAQGKRIEIKTQKAKA